MRRVAIWLLGLFVRGLLAAAGWIDWLCGDKEKRP